MDLAILMKNCPFRAEIFSASKVEAEEFDAGEVLAAIVGAELPEDLSAFYMAYRSADLGPVRILGYGFLDGESHDVLDATLEVMERLPSTPSVAIERLAGDRISAYVFEDNKWSIKIVNSNGNAEGAVESLAGYLVSRIAEETNTFEDSIAAVNLAVTEANQARSPNEFGVPESVSPAHNWRVNRYCVQDQILAAWVVRYSRRLGQTEVSAVACDTIDQAPLHAGAIAALATLAFDAYRNGGKIGLKFSPRLPTAIYRAAEELGIRLLDPEGINSEEIYAILAASAGVATLLHEVGLPTDVIGSVGFQVLQGVWNPSELAVLASFGEPAIGILLGGSGSTDAVADQVEIDLTASAILGGLAVRALANRNVDGDCEDAEIEMRLGRLPNGLGGARVNPAEDVQVPLGWELRSAAKPNGLCANTEAALLPRAVNSAVEIGPAWTESDCVGSRSIVVVPLEADVHPVEGNPDVFVAPISLVVLRRQAELRLRKLRQMLL